MVARVVVLCGSDQCVAPAAASLLRSSFARLGATDVQVASAGVRAAVSRGWCTVMAEELASAGDLVDPHRSQPVTVDLVRGADLLLVTERRYRGTTRLMDARSAPRTFTILEASLLAKEVRAAARPSESGPAVHPWRTSTRTRLRWLLAEMDAMRGLVALPDEPRGWHRRFGGRVVSGVDLLDPDLDHGSHKRTLQVLREALDDLVSTVDDVAPHPALV